MKVLVTGVGGFLGSHIAEHLIKLNHDVYGIDNFIGGEYNNCSYLPLKKRLCFFICFYCFFFSFLNTKPSDLVLQIVF